eukprot:1727730-Rhodomonas_salina.1
MLLWYLPALMRAHQRATCDGKRRGSSGLEEECLRRATRDGNSPSWLGEMEGGWRGGEEEGGGGEEREREGERERRDLDEDSEGEDGQACDRHRLHPSALRQYPHMSMRLRQQYCTCHSKRGRQQYRTYTRQVLHSSTGHATARWYSGTSLHCPCAPAVLSTA